MAAISSAGQTAAGAASPAATKIRWLRGLPKGSPDTVVKDSGEDPLSVFGEETGHKRPLERPQPLVVWAWVVAAFAVLEAALIAWMYVGGGTGSEGTLRVTSRPTSSTVIIDGTTRGATPLTLSLPHGEHRVEIRTAGASRVLNVPIIAGAESSQDFDLASLQEPELGKPTSLGSLEVTTESPGASVSIDGVSHGVTPMRPIDLSEGSHQIVLTIGDQSVNRQVAVQAGNRTTLFVPMIRSTLGLSGWVQISSPVVAQLYEQGRLLGTTETDRIMLPVGQHEVAIIIPTLDFSTTATLAVVAGKTTTFGVKLPTGRLYVNALPWADVWIDGQRVGETPLANVSLPIGPHELLFRHPQFGERRQTVTVKSSGITRIGLELGK